MGRGFRVVKGREGDGIELPRRQTPLSAGYDIASPIDVTIQPGEVALIPTGLQAYMEPDEELQLRPRSSLSIKRGLLLVNSPATIDADYAETGEEIVVALRNVGSDPVTIRRGERLVQGVFSKYLVTDDDSPVQRRRTGGIGSTGDR